jgi:hypothetical protein
VWAAGIQLSGLLTEDGTIEPDKLTAAVQTAREQLAIHRSSQPRSMIGLASGAAKQHEPPNKPLARSVRPSHDDTPRDLPLAGVQNSARSALRLGLCAKLETFSAGSFARWLQSEVCQKRRNCRINHSGGEH